MFLSHRIKNKKESFEAFGPLDNPFYKGDTMSGRSGSSKNFFVTLRDSSIGRTQPRPKRRQWKRSMSKKNRRSASKSSRKGKKGSAKGRLSVDNIDMPKDLFQFNIKIPEVELGTEVKIEVTSASTGERPAMEYGAFKKHFQNFNAKQNQISQFEQGEEE